MSGVRLDSPDLFRRVTLASLAANVAIVITGGVVRLTDSGLGCPTWPRCTRSSYVTTPAAGYHGIIEFGNRTLTYVLVALAAGALLLARLPGNRSARRVRLAWLGLATIPVQAIVGGLTVLTHLDPWVVSAHFLLSMAVIAVTYLLYVAAVQPDAPRLPTVAGALRALAWTVLAASTAVLAAGTVVTGSGPHAGDHGARRTGLDPGMVAQLHTDLVMLLIGLSLAYWFALRAAAAPHPAVRAAAVLVAVELAQGLIGFVQYFSHLPALLVGLHMAGACAVWVATLAILPPLSRAVADPLAAGSTGPLPAGSARPSGAGPQAGDVEVGHDRAREPSGGAGRVPDEQGRLGQLQLDQ
jgi:heme a synthase